MHFRGPGESRKGRSSNSPLRWRRTPWTGISRWGGRSGTNIPKRYSGRSPGRSKTIWTGRHPCWTGCTARDDGGDSALPVLRRLHPLPRVDPHDASVFPCHGPPARADVPCRFDGGDQDEFPLHDFQLHPPEGGLSARIPSRSAPGLPFFLFFPCFLFLLSPHLGGCDSCRDHRQPDVQVTHASLLPRFVFLLDENGRRLFPCRCRKIFFPTRLVIKGRRGGRTGGRGGEPPGIPLLRRGAAEDRR